MLISKTQKISRKPMLLTSNYRAQFLFKENEAICDLISDSNVHSLLATIVVFPFFLTDKMEKGLDVFHVGKMPLINKENMQKYRFSSRYSSIIFYEIVKEIFHEFERNCINISGKSEYFFHS